MLEKIKAAFSVLRAGSAMKGAKGMKQAQLASCLAALLSALAVLGKAFGYDLHLTDDQLVTLGSAGAILFGLFNGYATIASSEKVGLPGLAPAPPVPVQPEPQAAPTPEPTPVPINEQLP